jgi:hypothetical protein
MDWPGSVARLFCHPLGRARQGKKPFGKQWNPNPVFLWGGGTKPAVRFGAIRTEPGSWKLDVGELFLHAVLPGFWSFR